MKTLKFCCHALSIGIAVAVLAGCGESRSVAPQLPATSVQARVVAKHMKAPSYTIIDVGTLGGTFSEAVGVNDQGGVSGYSTLPSDTVIHAFYRHDSVMTDLGTLGGPNSYSPEAGNPNDRSEVAGMSDTSTYDQYSDNFCGLFDFQSTSPYICNAFVWRHRSMKALPTLGGPNAAAFEINSRGASVGSSETTIGPCGPAAFYFDGVIWGPQKGEMKKLSPLSGDNATLAGAINDKDEAVGTSGTCASGAIEAVLWRHGTPINLGTLGGAVFNIASGINNHSEVVGQSDLTGDQTHHAFLWRKGKMMDLGTLPGDIVSSAGGINDKSQIVGLSFPPGSSTVHGVLWQHGAIYDLNSLIPAHSDISVLEAFEINNRGQIVGYGLDRNTSDVHAYLATPCDAQNPDHKGCQDGRGTSRPIALPENVRRNLLRWNALHHISWTTNARP